MILIKKKKNKNFIKKDKHYSYFIDRKGGSKDMTNKIKNND